MADEMSHEALVRTWWQAFASQDGMSVTVAQDRISDPVPLITVEYRGRSGQTHRRAFYLFPDEQRRVNAQILGMVADVIRDQYNVRHPRPPVPPEPRRVD